MIGIDYGNGTTNCDLKTGIRYGVISTNSVSPDALADVYHKGEDLTYADAIDEMREKLKSVASDYVFESRMEKVLDALVETLTDAANDCDSLSTDGDRYRYEDADYTLETTSLGVYVIRSPYTTRCRYCSPCCPGAGNLDAPDAEGVETYCLGPDWFDADHVMPYVATLRGGNRE